MNIVVCTKPTPDTAAKVTVESGQVKWGDAPLVINPWDEYAVEEALRLKEKYGGKVIALTLGARLEAVKHALAMGADEAVLVSDPALAGSDALGTAVALAKAVEKIGGVDLVLLGKQAIDGDTGLTPGMLARKLGWPLLSFVAAIPALDAAARSLRAERALEEGRQVVTSALPAVISVVKEINEPRYPSFMGIRKASRAVIPTWSAADLGVGVGTPTYPKVTWAEVFNPPAHEGTVEILNGTPQAVAAMLADRLIAEKVI